MITASRPGGQAGRRLPSGSGGWVTWAARTSCEVRPVNGGRPETSSYPSTPSGVDVHPLVDVGLGRPPAPGAM